MTSTAELRSYSVTEGSLAVLQHAVSGLFSWMHGYPEDLGFVRADGTVILWSAAHENEGAVEVSSAEKGALMQTTGIRECIVWHATLARADA